MNRAWWVSVGLVSLAIGARNGWAQVVIQPDESNGTLHNDLTASMVKMSVGDFNGDGLDDVAVLMEASSSTRSIELFMAPYDKENLFSTKSTMTVRRGVPDDDFGLPSTKMADLNHDGRMDLAVNWHDESTQRDHVGIVFGNQHPDRHVNLDQDGGLLKIVGPTGVPLGTEVVAGDFNGNGAEDYAILSSTNETLSIFYFLMGQDGLQSGTVDLSVANALPQMSVSGYVFQLLSGNFNGDEATDLAFSSWLEVSDLPQKTSIVFGREPYPGPGVDVKIKAHYVDLSGNQTDIDPIAAGDISGDHLDELFVQGRSFLFPIFAVSGADIASGRPVLRQDVGFPESAVFYPVPADSASNGWTVRSANFDGDGADDLFSFYPTAMGGLLTSSLSPGVNALENLGSSALGWVGRFSSFGVGDLNGDGFGDLVTYENFGSIYPPYGALRILYGFHPLARPRVSVVSGPNERRRVTLSLSVEGSPTEMLFSGDLDSASLTSWVPYRASSEVMVSPGGGTKTIGVRFRNAVGRESETVETPVPVAVGNTPVVTDTNRLRPGGVVSFECHVRAPGTLRADLFGPGGERIRELENRSVESGIFPVQWNGQNAHGNRVVRGVYYLVIEVDGERTRKEILVE